MPGAVSRKHLDLKVRLEPHVDRAVAVLSELMDSTNEKVRLEAATYVLDQVHGKARQSVSHEGGATPLQHEVRIEIVRPA